MHIIVEAAARNEARQLRRHRLDLEAAHIELWRKLGDDGLRIAAYRGG
jgi:hypothetical protein